MGAIDLLRDQQVDYYYHCYTNRQQSSTKSLHHFIIVRKGES